MSGGAGNRVEIDTRELVNGIRQLVSGILRRTPPAAMQAANDTAIRLRPLIPVDSGALRDTVQPGQIDGGAVVHYGGDLAYKWIINAREGRPVERTLERAPSTFHSLAVGLTTEEIRRL